MSPFFLFVPGHQGICPLSRGIAEMVEEGSTCRPSAAPPHSVVLPRPTPCLRSACPRILEHPSHRTYPPRPSRWQTRPSLVFSPGSGLSFFCLRPGVCSFSLTSVPLLMHVSKYSEWMDG